MLRRRAGIGEVGQAASDLEIVATSVSEWKNDHPFAHSEWWRMVAVAEGLSACVAAPVKVPVKVRSKPLQQAHLPRLNGRLNGRSYAHVIRKFKGRHGAFLGNPARRKVLLNHRPSSHHLLAQLLEPALQSRRVRHVIVSRHDPMRPECARFQHARGHQRDVIRENGRR
jgi:hypothetical protein